MNRIDPTSTRGKIPPPTNAELEARYPDPYRVDGKRITAAEQTKIEAELAARYPNPGRLA